MTRRVRLWTTAVLSIAAMALTIGLSIAALAGAHAPTPTHAVLAGISLNAID